MLGRTWGAVLEGVDARLVRVEAHAGSGIPTTSAVGLPDTAVREGIDRVRAALENARFQLPSGKVIINLAPAELPKAGATLDLPIAMAVLAAAKHIPPLPEDDVLCGELALDGTVRPIRGALAIAIAAQRDGRPRLVVPAGVADEAALVDGLQVFRVATLADAVAFVKGPRTPPHSALSARELLEQARPGGEDADLREVRGQAGARRALELAAAGGHHLLMIGPPGAGKTMLARRLPGILPPLSVDEALGVTQVWSAVGLTRGLVVRRPFRAPHHGTSFAGLTGGGSRVRPGEISLATHGVLYLDELAEFRRDALEALRQPLESGQITVTRVRGSVTLPARFALVASMNPCPCGHHGGADGRCRCTPNEVRRYRGRVSGPLLDRFDLVVPVPAVDLESLGRIAEGEPSAPVRRRVIAARRRQQQRFRRTGPFAGTVPANGAGPSCNAEMRPCDLARWVPLGPAAHRLLREACERLHLSARAYDRVRRVARTLADLAGDRDVEPPHVAEALQYRHAELPDAD